MPTDTKHNMAVDPATGEIVAPSSVMTADEATTAITLRSAEGGGLVPRLTAREVLARLAAKAVELTEDDEAASDAIAESILMAETFEEILASQETVSSLDMIDVPFTLVKTSMMASSKSEKPSVYLVLRGRLVSNNDLVNITAGAKSVILQALVLEERGFLPAEVVIRRKSEATARGRYPLWLEAHTADKAVAVAVNPGTPDHDGNPEDPF